MICVSSGLSDSRVGALLQQERAGVTIAVDAEKIAAVVKAGDG